MVVAGYIVQPAKRFFGAAAVAGHVLAAQVATQQVVEIPSRMECPDCAVALSLVTSLGQGPDDALLMPTSAVAADEAGYFYAANGVRPGVIRRFDPSGRLVRVFGRSGSGPGEFGRLVNLLRVAPDGVIHVVEVVRHTILARGLDSLIRVTVLPRAAVDLLPLSGRGIVIHNPEPGPGGVVQLFTLNDAEGRYVRSFGNEPGLRPDVDWTYSGIRRLAFNTDTTFWAAWLTEYRADLWSIEGRKLLSITRKAEWFDGWTTTRDAGGLRQPPRPRIGSIWQDAENHLWVIVLMPDANWRPPGRGVSPRLSELNPSQIYDSIIEVLDVSAGRLLARGQFGEALVAVGSGFVAGHRESGAGVIVDIWRPSFQRASRR